MDYHFQKAKQEMYKVNKSMTLVLLLCFIVCFCLSYFAQWLHYQSLYKETDITPKLCTQLAMQTMEKDHSSIGWQVELLGIEKRDNFIVAGYLETNRHQEKIKYLLFRQEKDRYALEEVRHLYNSADNIECAHIRGAEMSSYLLTLSTNPKLREIVMQDHSYNGKTSHIPITKNPSMTLTQLPSHNFSYEYILK